MTHARGYAVTKEKATLTESTQGTESKPLVQSHRAVRRESRASMAGLAGFEPQCFVADSSHKGSLAAKGGWEM